MLKLLFLAAGVYVVWRLFWKKQVPQQRKKVGTGQMVQCAKCGTYTIIEEARIENDKYYCNTECVTNKSGGSE